MRAAACVQAEPAGRPWARIQSAALSSSPRQPRITYWLAPGRRITLLTAFAKTRSSEAADVARALRAQKTCQADHGPAHRYLDREAS